MPATASIPRTFAAMLSAPSGEVSHYEVSARTKTEAREKVRQLYRRDTPPPSAGFYSFAQMRLSWLEEEEA